jgi:hypothetical protein
MPPIGVTPQHNRAAGLTALPPQQLHHYRPDEAAGPFGLIDFYPNGPSLRPRPQPFAVRGGVDPATPCRAVQC